MPPMRITNGDLLDCPLCNGIEEVEASCPTCGTALEDGGPLENYFGPYSPYEEVEYQLKGQGSPPDQCLHLFYCPQCGWDERRGINKIPLE